MTDSSIRKDSSKESGKVMKIMRPFPKKVEVKVFAIQEAKAYPSYLETN